MASILRAGSRVGTEFAAKNSYSLLPRSSVAAPANVGQMRWASSEEKAANKKAVAQALGIYFRFVQYRSII